MNTVILKLSINRITILLLISLWLINCSNSTNQVAPISFINDSNYSSDTPNNTKIIPSLKTNDINISDNIRFNTTEHGSVIQSKTQKTNDTQNIKLSSSEKIKKGKYITYNRDYRNIKKGSYTGDSVYIVKHGDTLFYISWITGNNFQDLAQQNNIQDPYILHIGQMLKINKINYSIAPLNNKVSTTDTSKKNDNIKYLQNVDKIIASRPKITYTENCDKKITSNIGENNTKFSTLTPVTASVVNSTKSIVGSSTPSNASIFVWLWPTKGKVIEYFTSSEGGSKGINIKGTKGQAIVATTNGRVVYAGNALRGYGNLIIIKHNDDYLSAYAHNDTILVREQEEVKAGQKIATMGSSGTNFTCLHFEIRYKGKPVNPLQFLPQQ